MIGTSNLEGTRGSILKGTVLTMFKYVPVALNSEQFFLLDKSSLLTRSAKNFNDIEFKLRERTHVNDVRFLGHF